MPTTVLKIEMNRGFLEQRLTELKLSRSETARRIGVNRNTIGRWISGEVRYALPDNILRLSEELSCHFEDLIVKDSLLHFNDSKKQRVAARKIEGANLESILSENGEHRFLEEIVRSVLSPELPGPLRARMYNALSLSLKNQGKLRGSLENAYKASYLASRFRDRDAQDRAMAVITQLEARGVSLESEINSE